MAKGDTKTDNLLDIAAHGTRADLPTDTCCNTKTQNYILDVAQRIINVEEEVEELKDNPDVSDIVDTYADLLAYDTSKLTDKDIIRVLNDETHNGESTYYRYDKTTDSWTYIGSTGPRNAQSDWSENDPTDPAYILNRPLYTETTSSEFEQGTTTTSGSTPDTDYVWFIEQFQDYALHTVLADFQNGDTVYATITYSVDGVEKSDTGKFTLTFEDSKANLDYDAEAGSRWYGAYISEVNLGDTTVRWPVLATDSSATVYIADIEYEKVKQIDAKYVPIDGDTITINANGELQSSGGGGGTTNFDQLTNRPSYNGVTMTGSTNIPEVKAYTAGTNVSISGTTISATDTTYSAGTGLSLTGTTFSADTSVLATQTDLSGKQNALTAGANITLSGDTISATDTTYSNFTGTDGTSAGVAGLVPAPATTDAGKFLKADGTWDTAGGPSINVVQTTGTSTTDVMSQNAVTGMVFADPSTKQKVTIGASAQVSGTGFDGIAIGHSSTVVDSEGCCLGAYTTVGSSQGVAIGRGAFIGNDMQGAVALGAGARPSSKGEVAIGTFTTDYGYNFSKYRLLTGLYDPQSAHDAATKGYVDTAVAGASYDPTISNNTLYL